LFHFINMSGPPALEVFTDEAVGQTPGGLGNVLSLHSVPRPEGLHSLEKQFALAKNQLQSVLIGMEDVIETALACAFTSGHILLQGAPGLGKTLLAKSIAQVLGLGFNRVQCTADLMPSDFTGTVIRPEGSNEFILSRGPIF